jgi:predicted nucleic acid-binding Zn ribbon protein
MYCKFHPEKKALNRCAMCGHPLCEYCSHAIMLGEYYCYSCSLSLSVPPKAKKRWIPFNYVLIAFGILIAILIVTILIQ